MKAQLILVGGRPIPNVLTILHQRPELIVAVCSKQSFKKEWPKLEKAVRKFLPEGTCTILPKKTDGFSLEEIKTACESELYQSHDWLFNITSGTTIMSIGAYEVAKKYAQERSVDCWYLDTARTDVVALTGKQPDDEEIENIFTIRVDEYVTTYDYSLGGEKETSFKRADWLDFAKTLGQNPDEIKRFELVLNEVKKQRGNRRKEQPLPSSYSIPIPQSAEKTFALFKVAQNAEIVSNLQRVNGETMSFSISEQQYSFLGGKWLELYVWSVAEELRKQNFFTDCQWSRELLDSNGKELSATKNLQNKEIDVSMTYNAQLIVVECKTGKNALKQDNLNSLVALADLLGDDFVTKLFVTDQDRSEKPNKGSASDDENNGIDAALAHISLRKIRLIGREDLPNIDTILREEAQNPKHWRG